MPFYVVQFEVPGIKRLCFKRNTSKAFRGEEKKTTQI